MYLASSGSVGDPPRSHGAESDRLRRSCHRAGLTGIETMESFSSDDLESIHS